MKFTVLGGNGFIGNHMIQHLQLQGHEVIAPERTSTLDFALGHVIYAIGIVGGAKERATDMIEAHAALTHRILSQGRFDTWLYLSSTRMYAGLPSEATATENTSLPLTPSGYAVFDASKFLGECVCMSFNNPKIRIARLSNIYGANQSIHTFLGSIFKDIKEKGSVMIGESPQSSKDYLAIQDAVKLLEDISLSGKDTLYNVASGTVTTHANIAETLQRLGYKVSFANNGPIRAFPRIDTQKIVQEFGVRAYRKLTDNISTLLA